MGSNVRFGDLHFDRVIRHYMDKNNSEISTYDLATLECLVIENVNLTDIRDLHYFTGLKKLVLFNIGVKDIKIISDLNKLEYLVLSNNGIQDIKPLANLKNLKYLQLYYFNQDKIIK